MWHTITVINTWQLTVLKSLVFSFADGLAIKEGISSTLLTHPIILIEDTLVRANTLSYDLSFLTCELVLETGFLDVMLDGQLVKDIVKVFIKLSFLLGLL